MTRLELEARLSEFHEEMLARHVTCLALGEEMAQKLKEEILRGYDAKIKDKTPAEEACIRLVNSHGFPPITEYGRYELMYKEGVRGLFEQLVSCRKRTFNWSDEQLKFLRNSKNEMRV